MSKIVSTDSLREYKALKHLPQSTDIAKLRKMSEKCAALTPIEIHLYGGIPALIYSRKTNNFGLSNDFFVDIKLLFREMDSKEILKNFIDQLLTGQPSLRGDVRNLFYRFSSITIDD